MGTLQYAKDSTDGRYRFAKHSTGAFDVFGKDSL